MPRVHTSAARQVIAKHIANTSNIPVVSNVRCVRLYRKKNGFGLNFTYLYRPNMEGGGYENVDDEYEDDVSGSEADISGDSSDTSSNKDDTVDKMFLKWVVPDGSADQAGLMKGDEVISLNNSAVYGKHASDIDNLIQHSQAIDLDVIEDPAKRKSKQFQRYRGNGYEVHVVHRGSQDDLSDHELLDTDSNATRDQYFVVTYGKPSESGGHKSRIHPFLRPASYSDDEPLMENKSVSFSEKRSEDVIGRTQNICSFGKVDSRRGNKMSTKKSGLSSSTSSSVLVESQDPKPDIQVTITTATYSTLAEPQTTRTSVSNAKKDDTSSGNRLLVSQENDNVWELKVPQTTYIRPRSPSPAHRRVSYLMATEGDGSLSSGMLEFRSLANGDTTDDGLSPFEEENNIFHSENESEKHMRSLHLPRDESLEDDDVEDNAEHAEVADEEKRHSLKRKCSADSVEVDKEGYLKRKYGATHGRRSWKRVYVVLKAHIIYIHKDKPDQMISSGQDEKPISIKSCIVDIAYDYRKRENVFKLATYNGSQYLFQAKDRDDMMSWIEIIQKNNNPDEDTFGRTSEDLIIRKKKNMDFEISSQTTNKALPPASLKIGTLKKSLSLRTNSGSQSSFKVKNKAIEGDSGKATWHSKVVKKVRRIGNPTNNSIPQYQAQGFSSVTSLESCPKSKTNSSLPLLVEHCCNVVENRALETVGIYRVPGNSAMVTALEEELRTKTPEGINFNEPKWNDANNMGSLLRNFLRKLPEGLVTAELYEKFINANRIEGDERMWSLKSLIQQLPPAYNETLRFIITHLKKVSEHSDKNKMEVRNIAIIFGPTIVRTEKDNMTTMVNDMSDRFRIVESFINHFDWFFDSEPVADGDNTSSPVSPPAEVSSPVLVSSKAMDSIEQAAVNYESDPPWKSKGGSIKMQMFKTFRRTQSSESSRSSESSKKHDVSPDSAASSEALNGQTSPTNLPHRFGGNSQPSSPSAGRRKFVKRHHSSTNISMTEARDEFDRSKSEGEEDDHTFYAMRPSHSTKAYSYARPPPPSYRESRNKARAQNGNNKDVSQETGDFNSLSDETKRRLLRLTLRKKVNEKLQNEASSPPTTQNEAVENVENDIVTVTIPSKNSNTSQVPTCSTSDEPLVVCEKQLSPSEARQRFEQQSNNDKTSGKLPLRKAISCDPVRRRDGSASSSSSRNFKIYSKGDVTFSHCQPHQINEWMRDLGLSTRGATERGRARAKTEDLNKTLRRSSSVARTSFTQDDDEILMKRRSLSCQDINVGDEDVITRARTLSKSSDSSQSSDEDEDPTEASCEAFDQKLRGLMQESKLDSKSMTELQQARKTSQVNRPPSYRVNRTSVDKMRDMDPSSNIQTGAVSSIKSLFESGVAHQQIAKSRSSSVSSASSGSVLSNDTQRKSSSSAVSDAEVKRRVWETGEGKSGEGKKRWKEPEWVARERAIKNLQSGSDTSIKEKPDDNNNLPKGRESKLQYSRSTSLPIRDAGFVIKDVTVEQKWLGVKTCRCKPVVKKYSTNNVKCVVESPIIQQVAVKNGPVIRKVTPVSSVQYKPEAENQSENRSGQMWSVHYKSESKSQPESRSVSSAPCNSESDSGSGSVPFVQRKAESKPQSENRPRDIRIKNNPHNRKGRTQSSPLRSDLSSQEGPPPPTSPPVVISPTNNGPASTRSHPFSSPHKQRSARPRRRIVSETTRGAHTGTRLTGRTFTAPLLGTTVTTTNAIELAGFAIKPESINRTPKSRGVRRSEKQDDGGSQGGQKMTNDMDTLPANLPRTVLAIPNSSSSSEYGSPSIRRKALALAVPEMNDSKRLSTDRRLLEQNALHIKELLDEMNTEHSLKMERQKSDTISINAQKAARNKARIRRLSLGQEREKAVVVASHVSPAVVLNERNGTETQAPRNISTVEWVGVSS